MKLTEVQLEKLINQNVPSIKLIAQKYYIAGGSKEDLIQEGLIGFVDGVNSFNEKFGDVNSESFKKFTLMCAKRQILDAVKKSNSKKNMPLNNSISINDGGYNSVGEIPLIKTPEDIIIEEDLKSEKVSHINLNLSQQEKQVLDLYLDGLKQTEIAKQLNRPVKSVDNALQRIKNKLKGKS